ncbi:hypothetical protein D3C76_1829270 [compost metagenome]
MLTGVAQERKHWDWRIAMLLSQNAEIDSACIDTGRCTRFQAIDTQRQFTQTL